MKREAVQAVPSNNNKTNNEHFETKKKMQTANASFYCHVINVFVIISNETSKKYDQKRIIF